jgi:hypothetical protein
MIKADQLGEVYKTLVDGNDEGLRYGLDVKGSL